MQDRLPPDRRKPLATRGRTIHWVNMRNPRCEQMFSALLPTSDVIRQRSSWATSITARTVGHPAEGKALRPQHSPRVVFFELVRFRAVGQKASLGTPQAGARPMTRPRGLRAAHAPLRRPLPHPHRPGGNNEPTRGAGRAEDRCSRKPLADLLHPQIFRRFLAAVRDDIERNLGAIRQAVQAGLYASY